MSKNKETKSKTKTTENKTKGLPSKTNITKIKTKSTVSKTNDLDVYVVTCTYFERSNYNTHIYVLKDKKSADKKVESLHKELCDSDTYNAEHTTYEEHCNIEEHDEDDEMHLNISVKKQKLCLSKDDIISFSSYS